MEGANKTGSDAGDSEESAVELSANIPGAAKCFGRGEKIRFVFDAFSVFGEFILP